MPLEPISTAEAARRLGVTATTVRRMIAAGQLQAVEEPRPQGARLRVLWDSAAPSADSSAAESSTKPAEELAWLRSRIEAGERERDELRQLLAMQAQTIATLSELARALPSARNIGTQHDATGDATPTQQGEPPHSAGQQPRETARVGPLPGWWSTAREGKKGLGASLTLTGFVAIAAGIILHLALRANVMASETHLGYVIGLVGLLSLLIGLVLVF